MRALKFQFHPEQVRISPDEILADLRYPVKPNRAVGSRRAEGRRRARR